MYSPYNLVEDCPECGQKDELNKWGGARMSSTEWGHSYSCCSEKCGIAFATNPKRFELELEALDLKKQYTEREIANIKENLMMSIRLRKIAGDSDELAQ